MLINMGIYSITNKINGKRYIGSAKNIERRWYWHRCMLHRGEHHSRHLQASWNKYEEKTFVFEVISPVWNVEKLVKIEQTFIDLYQTADARFGYNSNPTAGSHLGSKQTEETKKKIGVANSGPRNGMYGKVSFMAGKKHTTTANQKNREAHVGKKASLDTREKMRAAHTGREHSEETKEKMRLGKLGRNNPMFGRYGELSSRAKFTWAQVREIRTLYTAGGISQRKLAKEFNTSQSQINDIVNFKTWVEAPND